MRKVFDVRGKLAVITGAASGIGRAIACSLAGRGCDLALADIDEAGLAETARLTSPTVQVTRHNLDVGDAAAVATFPAEVRAAHGRVDILVNNAGVALGGSFAQVSAEDFDWLMGINFNGVVWLTRAFLPMLAERPQAQLVNISSLFGLVAPPGQTAYSAAKFAVRGFSQALRHELMAANSPVGVTIVHPGGVKTSIARNARVPAGVNANEGVAQIERLLTLPPEAAGEIIVKGIIQRRPRVLVGKDAKLISVIERMMPVNYWKALTLAL